MGEDTDSRDTGEDVAPPRAKGNGKQPASTGILLAAVLAILAAGALLRAEKRVDSPPPGRDELPAAAATVEPEPVPAIPPDSAPAPPVPAPPRAAPSPTPAPPGDLGRRATRDWKRLSAGRGGFTAQVAMTCEESNTRASLQRAEGSEKLYLIAFPSRGPTCFRICWGKYASAGDATAARDVPAFLRKGGGRPTAKSIAEIAP
jgi:hypothetical protein